MPKWLGWKVQFSYNHIAMPLLQTGAEWLLMQAEQSNALEFQNLLL